SVFTRLEISAERLPGGEVLAPGGLGRGPRRARPILGRFGGKLQDHRLKVGQQDGRVVGRVEEPLQVALVLDGRGHGDAIVGLDPEGEYESPDLKFVAVADHHLAVDRLAVEEGAVATLEVADPNLPGPGGDGAVKLAHSLAVRAEVALGVPPDQ